MGRLGRSEVECRIQFNLLKQKERNNKELEQVILLILVHLVIQFFGLYVTYLLNCC